MSPFARSRDRHLDLRTVLDYLDQRLDASSRRAADDHLGRPCETCREQVREVGELLEAMRRDRTEDVPERLHALAVAAFAPRTAPAPAKRLAEILAELVFDSLRSPLPATARRSVGEARRVRFRAGDATLDLELEPEGATTQSLRGRLEAEDAALWTLEFRAGTERARVHPDATGAFVVDRLPLGALEAHLEGPLGRFRLPPLEP